VKFEYDPNKSRQNQLKHGLSFEEAQVLWQDFNRIEISAKSVDEPRFMIISKFQEKHWSAIITYRDQTIRIISVRRSKESEVKLYEG
jgi:uncharacterized DUF497 family protein